MKLKFFSVFIVSTVLIFGLYQPIYAFTFEKNLLVSDAELENDDALTTRGIQAFLEEKGSVLANYTVNGLDGNETSVARIISSAAKKYMLNPMLFLVMAQKESSAITSSILTYAIDNWILGFGRCDGCSESQAAPYRGIAKQFDAAGDRIRNGYLSDLEQNGQTISGWGPGITKTTIDGIQVTPRNDATAALYTYNPCVGAYGGGYSQYGCNSAFQKLWQAWNPNIRYPNGSLLQIDNSVYLIQDGKKRPFTSQTALLANYNVNNIIAVSTVVGEQYENGPAIYIPNYALLRSPDGLLYLYVDGTKRHIVSERAFKKVGFNVAEIIDVSRKEINAIPDGAKITGKTEYPQGALFQKKNGDMSYLDSEGVLHEIAAQEIADNRFPGKAFVPVTSEDLTDYAHGDPLVLKDGTLVRTKTSRAVYVIANGKKRPFASVKAFEYYGYVWDNIVVVPNAVLKLHPDGAFIQMPK